MKRSWLGSLKVYFDRRILSVLLLGFSSGLPLALVYWTLSAWLSEEGVSKTAIGLFSWASTAYSIKFLWSPVVDHLSLGPLTHWLGRRRSWLLLSQIAVAACIFGLSRTDPSEQLSTVAMWCVALAFASATQDIVIDAYRIEILEEHRMGAGASMAITGYRVAMLASGGGALILADKYGWNVAYLAMAALMIVGVLATLTSLEPDVPKRPAPDGVVSHLQEALVAPFMSFFRSSGVKGAIVILAFIAFYKYGDALLGAMANPFYLEIGFTKTQVGVITKGWGLVMTLLGTFAGGAMVAKLGLHRALLIAGILQALSNLVFAWQAMVGASVPALTVTIVVENFTGGLGTAAFVAYLSSLCDVAFSATQYALLSSLMGTSRTFFASGGGWLADQVDWVSYFLITTAAAIPGLVLLLVLMKMFPPKEPVPAAGPPPEADS
ncbi:MAG: AmpG family muropeptide MFS transporter [Acidobacteriota bacterium]